MPSGGCPSSAAGASWPEPEDARKGVTMSILSAGIATTAEGPRVGLLEGRMGSEAAELVRRHGGVPRLAPAVREVPVDAAARVGELIDSLSKGAVQVVLFLTGAGATGLISEAERLGRKDELLEGLRATINVCRGQKPWAPLKRNAVPIAVTARAPYTAAEVLEALEPLGLAGKGVALLHYGERNEAIAAALEAWGSRLFELCLYAWRLPEDTTPIEALVDEVIAGELHAVAFTSQVQVRHLFQVASARGLGDELARALDSRTVVAAVGPTCASALEEVGVRPCVVPENPKMGPMVVALMAYLRDGGRPASSRPQPQRDGSETAEPEGGAIGGSLSELVQSYERGLLEDALRTTRGNRAKAAKLLQTTERIIGYRIRQYSIDWKRYRR